MMKLSKAALQGASIVALLNRIHRLFPVALLVLPGAAHASELYDLTVTMPISEGGAEVELRQVTFATYYSPLETRVDVVTWDPCTAKDRTVPCNLVNPVNASNFGVAIRAHNAGNIDEIDSCYVDLDVRNLDLDEIVATVNADNPKAHLMRLTLESIERNTRGSDEYKDCLYRPRGHERHPELADFSFPVYLHPIIPSCEPYSQAGREQASASNDQGMDYYRAKDWDEAARAFIDAAARDCSYFIALTNLASVLSIQEKYTQAQAVLWRAYKLNPERTMQKLESDPDYAKLKHWTNFYAAGSAIGMSYRRHCYEPADPAQMDPDLPGLIDESGVNDWNLRYSVATRYAFRSDFNRNGIADWVYPLVHARLSELLVVFDGDQLNAPSCTSTPLLGSDMIKANRADPCETTIFAGRQGPKIGIRLETDTFGVNRVVCHNE